ncbi:MAG: hypothetical protein D6696_04340 [Acidobacteria bacterium]|nr:MAG: hypothetical protein D6696_04340 [Acidobacteriota bacterium]
MRFLVRTLLEMPAATSRLMLPAAGGAWDLAQAARTAVSEPIVATAQRAARRLPGNAGRLAIMASETFLPALFEPCTPPALNAAVGQRAVEGCRLAADGPDALLALEEVRNKAAIFLLVLGVGRLIGVPSTFPLPLDELLRRAYGLGDFPALWAVEGLGHDYGESFFDAGVEPRGILSEASTADLPAKSLTMLNAGIGLAFAERRLRGLDPRASVAAVERAVTHFAALCQANARRGYLGAALESLGLTTRLFFPSMLAPVAAAVARRGPLADYFWHGVGRAIYFAPLNNLPFSLWQAFETAVRTAPDGRARRNAVAGVAWASTLVNQLEPQILADLLVGPHGARLARDGGFTNGLASAIMMRFDTTPGASFIEAFCRYRPANPRTAAWWAELVRRPCRLALEVIYPRLKRQGRLGELFRFHPLERLAAGAPVLELET